MSAARRARIAFLGWGSLLWDPGHDFARWHGPWYKAGPTIPIEFSRVSDRRAKALTLVIDSEHGQPIRVAWCLSKRQLAEDAVCDLRCREGTTLANIGCLKLGESVPRAGVETAIAAWANRKRLDVVAWTDLRSNFRAKTKLPFSIASALAHIKGLGSDGKAKAAEYVWRAPAFVKTPLRDALQAEPWFGRPGG